jgi:hypothetical protein
MKSVLPVWMLSFVLPRRDRQMHPALHGEPLLFVWRRRFCPCQLVHWGN